MQIEINSDFLKSLEEKCLAVIESGDPEQASRFAAATGFMPGTFNIALETDPQLLATRIERHQSLRRTDTSKLREELDEVVAGHKWSDLVVQDGINHLQALRQEMQDYPDMQNEARGFTKEHVDVAIFALTSLQHGRPTPHFNSAEASILLSIADTIRNGRVAARDALPFNENLRSVAHQRSLREKTDILNSASTDAPNIARPSHHPDQDGPSR